MSSIARILGAPLSVPAGKLARSTSSASSPGRSRPSTLLTMCITCEYRSMPKASVTLTLPVSAMRPTSLRARSISITCSARSFGSASNSASSALSCSCVAPRGRVPAIGRTVTTSCGVCPGSAAARSWRTRISGEEPTIWKPPMS